MVLLREPTTQFGVSRYFGNGHNGIDYKFPSNTPVYAAADGKVAFKGSGVNHPWMLAAAGTCVIIAHADMHTGYAHLNSTVVNTGQLVKQGQLIGYSGSTGNSTGSHLHFEVLPPAPNFKNGYSGRVDPKPYLQGDKTVTQEDLDYIYQYGALRRQRSPGEGEDVYLGKTAAFVIKDHRDSAEGRAKAAELAAAYARPTIVEKPIEVIKEVIKEVPVEKIKEVEVIREVVKSDDERSLADLLVAAFKKLTKIK